MGDAFNPELGFVRRRGIRHGYATFGAHPRPSWARVQEINPYGELHYITSVTNLRLRFIHAPLSDLFLVYTERRDVKDNVVLDRVVTAKVTKLFAF